MLYRKSGDASTTTQMSAEHMAKDYQMFCVTNFFYSVTLLDQICSLRRTRKTNLAHLADFLQGLVYFAIFAANVYRFAKPRLNFEFAGNSF